MPRFEDLPLENDFDSLPLEEEATEEDRFSSLGAALAGSQTPGTPPITSVGTALIGAPTEKLEPIVSGEEVVEFGTEHGLPIGLGIASGALAGIFTKDPVKINVAGSLGVSGGIALQQSLKNLSLPEEEKQHGLDVAADALIGGLANFTLGQAGRLVGKTPVGMAAKRQASKAMDVIARNYNKTFNQLGDPLRGKTRTKAVRAFKSDMNMSQKMAEFFADNPRDVVKVGAFDTSSMSVKTSKDVVRILDDGINKLREEYQRKIIPTLRGKKIPLHSVRKDVAKFKKKIVSGAGDEAGYLSFDPQQGYRGIPGLSSRSEAAALNHLSVDLAKFDKNPTALSAHKLKMRIQGMLNDDGFINKKGDFTNVGRELVKLKKSINNIIEKHSKDYAKTNIKYHAVFDLKERLGTKINADGAHRLMNTYFSDSASALTNDIDDTLRLLGNEAQKRFHKAKIEAVRANIASGKIQQYNTGVGFRLPFLPIGERVMGVKNPVNVATDFGTQVIRDFPSTLAPKITPLTSTPIRAARSLLEPQEEKTPGSNLLQGRRGGL